MRGKLNEDGKKKMEKRKNEGERVKIREGWNNKGARVKVREGVFKEREIREGERKG